MLQFFLNRSFVFPESGLERVKGKYTDKKFFTEKYDPKETFLFIR